MREGDTSMKITAIGGDLSYEGHGKFNLRDIESKEMKERKIKRIKR
jgi:hypothetical protein